MTNWISVKDRMPEPSLETKIIVSEYSHYKHKYFVSVYYYVSKNNWQDAYGEPADQCEYEIQYWQPLPKPVEVE